MEDNHFIQNSIAYFFALSSLAFHFAGASANMCIIMMLFAIFIKIK